MTNKKEILHPFLTVTNIKDHIPIQLELEEGLYSTWSQLFKTHCKAYRVLDHIIPSSIDAAGSSTLSMADKEEWEYVDALVLTWIYGSISRTLLSIIVKVDTAQKAWDALQDLFQDDKKTMALSLEDQFTHAELSQFADVSAYCLHLKSLADQLDNVGAPVSDQRLVLQLTKGISTTYNEMATALVQQNPLPTFHQARLKLILHERRHNHQAAQESSVDATALPAAQQPDDEPGFSLSPKSGGNTNAGGNNHQAAQESSVDATALPAAQQPDDEPGLPLSPKSGGNTNAGFSRRNNRIYQGLRPKVFVGHTIYTETAALRVDPRPTNFILLESGAFKLARKGYIMLQFAPRVRRYDWRRKQGFALSVPEIGKLLSSLGYESCEFVHDPNEGNSDEGKVRKVLIVEPSPDGYFFSLRVKNEFSNLERTIYITISRAEFTVLFRAFYFILPYLLGWHIFADPILPDDRNRANSSHTRSVD